MTNLKVTLYHSMKLYSVESASISTGTTTKSSPRLNFEYFLVFSYGSSNLICMSLSFNKSITYSCLIWKNSLTATVNTPIQLLECFFWRHWVAVQQIHNHGQNTLRSLESLYYLLIFFIVIIMTWAITYVASYKHSSWTAWLF